MARQRPYVSGELFWQEGSADPDGADRLRLTAGVRGDPEDTIEHAGVSPLETLGYLKTDAYFTYEYNRGAKAPDSAIAGLKLGLFF
jgi:hypothetical protein